jgi:hypothetical protein
MADHLREYGPVFFRQPGGLGLRVWPEALIVAVGAGAAANPRYDVVDGLKHRLPQASHAAVYQNLQPVKAAAGVLLKSSCMAIE